MALIDLILEAHERAVAELATRGNHDQFASRYLAGDLIELALASDEPDHEANWQQFLTVKLATVKAHRGF
jgi:hypothetical protein